MSTLTLPRPLMLPMVESEITCCPESVIGPLRIVISFPVACCGVCANVMLEQIARTHINSKVFIWSAPLFFRVCDGSDAYNKFQIKSCSTVLVDANDAWCARQNT